MTTPPAPRSVSRIPIVRTLRGYRRAWFRADGLASLTLWALLVPQALAYSSLAGLQPAAGFAVALLGMVVYGVLGTSRLLTVGPGSTVAIIVAGTVAPVAAGDPRRYAAIAALLAVMTGGMLFFGALLHAEFLTKVFSAPVLVGYLTGSGLVIIASQLSKVLGYSVRGSYPTVLGGVIQELDRTNPAAVLLGLATVAVMLAVRRWLRRVPAALVALAVATAAAAALGLDDRIPVVGPFDVALRLPELGLIRLSDVNALVVPSLSLAVFIFATGVLTGRATAPAAADEIEPRKEFVALGWANLGAGLAGGFPADGSDSRTVALAQGGARTQVASLLGALLVLVSVLLLTPLFALVPLAALGAVILVTAAGLLDIAGLRRLYRLRTADFVLAVITLTGVLVTGPMGGIVVGVVASLLDVIRRTVMPRTAVLGRVPDTDGTWRPIAEHDDAVPDPGVLVYRFEAPLFFGNADLFREELLRLADASDPPVHDVVVNAEGMNDLDVTGAQTLRTVVQDLDARGAHLSFVRLRKPVRDLMSRLGLEEYAVSYGRVEDAVRSAQRRAGTPGPGRSGQGDPQGADG